jgi:1-acyl-sn-glycerol-3-phosphate acyltransferase
MVKSVWYFLIKQWIKIALSFFYKSIHVTNKQNLPKTGPVIVVANHQNTLLDPLLIACFMPRTFFFLLRASFFGSKVGRFFAQSLNMMPIYRPRDGANFSSKNEAIFNHCVGILNKQKTLLIFPEGSHLGKWTLRPLQKGFARIAQAYLSQSGAKPLHIVPVGINYFNLQKAKDHVVINIGEAIELKSEANHEGPSFLNDIKLVTYEGLKNTILFITNNEQYDALENQCKHILHNDGDVIGNLEKAKQFAASNYDTINSEPYLEKYSFELKHLLWPLHLIPHLIASKIKSTIKDPQFKPSVYVVVSLVIHTLQIILLFLLY